MAKRVREEEHGQNASVEELCKSVKRLQTEARFAADQNQVPHGEGPKLPFPSLDHLGPAALGPDGYPQQPQRQGSIVDLAQWGEHQQGLEGTSLYHQTNMMLRDMHLERLRRLGHAPT